MTMYYSKKKFLRFLKIPVIVVICTAFFINHPPASASAQESTLSEIQEKLQSKLDEYKENNKKEAVVTRKLQDLNKDLKKKEAELKHYGRQLSQTQAEIQDLSAEIDRLSSKLESNMQHLQDIIISFYKQQYDSNALLLLSASDYQDMIQKMKYASLLAHYDSSVITQYGDQIKEINEKKAQMEALQKNLRDEEELARIKRNRLNEESQKKDKLLAELKAKRAMYEEKIKELEASSQKVQAMLADIQSRALPKSIRGNGFISLKGRLPWPVPGEIMTLYDKNSELPTGTSALKSGIEIKAKPGNDVYAVAGGRVVYTDIYQGYGRVVIIDHGDGYHSLYGNLSDTSLEKGNIVIEGSKVGSPAQSKTLNVPSLYFEIRYKGRPVDRLMGWMEQKARKKS
ncbi:MAG: peptidoglycan DD-metalloendopeptidase family protein [Nitrospirota bacterium]